jgi:hypothetical protein
MEPEQISVEPEQISESPILVVFSLVWYSTWQREQRKAKESYIPERSTRKQKVRGSHGKEREGG